MMSVTAWLFPVVRGAILLAIVLLIGTVVAHRLAARHLAADPAAMRHVSAWQARLPGLLAWFLLTLSVARGLLQVLSFTEPGEPIDGALVQALLLEGTWGTAWMIQTIAAFVLLAGSWLLRRHPARAATLAVVAVAAITWAQGGMGHAADELWPGIAGRAVSALHLLGAGTWIGALAILALTTFPALDATRVPALAAVVRDFSVPARVGATLIAVSGAVAGWMYVGSLAAVTGTPYGRLLLAKAALFAAVAAAGWWNWRVVTPRIGSTDDGAGMLRRAVTIELLLAFVAIAVSGVLTGTAIPVHEVSSITAE